MNGLLVTGEVVVVSKGEQIMQDNTVYYKVGIGQDGNVGTYGVSEEQYRKLDAFMYQPCIAVFQFSESVKYGNKLRLLEIIQQTKEKVEKK